tara:strand:- start:213 stop:863 length:651 start_codon:yes stop_codon:yes gene_type:complete
MDTEREDRTLTIIMILSIIGLIDSIYLSYLHHLVAGGGGCPTQNLPGLDCGVVLASDQAKLLGIPVAWLGVLGFIGLFSLSLDRYLNMDLERTYYNTILLPITGIIGTVFGIYLTYAEAFIIHQWCPFCLIAFGLTLGATFFAVKTYGSGIGELVGHFTKEESGKAKTEEILDSQLDSNNNLPKKTSDKGNVTNVYNISDSIINHSKIGNVEEEEE